MPPKGFKTITIAEGLLIDLQLIMLETKSRSISKVLERLVENYRKTRPVFYRG